MRRAGVNHTATPKAGVPSGVVVWSKPDVFPAGPGSAELLKGNSKDIDPHKPDPFDLSRNLCL